MGVPVSYLIFWLSPTARHSDHRAPGVRVRVDIVAAWLEIDEVEQSFLRRSDECALPRCNVHQLITKKQLYFDPPKVKVAKRCFPGPRARCCDARHDWRSFGDETIVRQRRLQADVGTTHHTVGDQDRVWSVACKKRQVVATFRGVEMRVQFASVSVRGGARFSTQFPVQFPVWG